ncbi:inositol monophosphatase family protein [Nocardioides limicola]|uniref:inositol monophosphatase family protein n=1 Tax=Nocardioides limicola TaxID=2803368 RepID=UPI0027DD7C63|nr:inositol monophosphatase family protein [Nocardioides sp. DJM-14]
MITPPEPHDVTLAAEVVQGAGRLAHRMRYDGLSVSTKTSNSDLVTAADHAAEELVVSLLVAACPDDAIVGEEGSDRRGTSGRDWVVDPVDGTWNFVHGLDHWCSAVALRDPDGIRLGAVHHPASDRVWVGGPGLRTTVDGVELPLLDDLPLAEVGIATYLHPTDTHVDPIATPWRRVSAAAATVRVLGSASMDMVSVASGGLGCWAQHSLADWDLLPGLALVLGVGGTYQQVDVGGVTWTVAGRPTAVAEAVALLRG